MASRKPVAGGGISLVLMRILIIGGTGFIGRLLVSHLKSRDHHLAVFHRGLTALSSAPALGEILGDRRNLPEFRTQLERFSPELVVDMALSSGKQARALMETFRGLARRAVVVSSMDVYRACGVLHGTEPGPVEPMPLREESPLRANAQAYPPDTLKVLRNLFGWLDEEYDKVAVEKAVQGDADLPVTVLRLPMVYGPGDPLHRLFPILKRIDDGRPAILLSDRLARWRGPRGYVENVAAAIALAAESERASGRVFNVAEPQAFSELEWMELVATTAGWRGNIAIIPDERAPAHLKFPGKADQHWVADTSRIREELGYREPVPVGDAIARTIAWEREHPPEQIDSSQFDYAAEDQALQKLA